MTCARCAKPAEYYVYHHRGDHARVTVCSNCRDDLRRLVQRQSDLSWRRLPKEATR